MRTDGYFEDEELIYEYERRTARTVAEAAIGLVATVLLAAGLALMLTGCAAQQHGVYPTF